MSTKPAQNDFSEPADDRLDFGDLEVPKERGKPPLDFGEIDVPACDFKDWGEI
ncbi:hypothetical protein [Neorhizobium tomejilense]|uniref:hypothetical protein n=1 Tax=Neorhizobium tomejilense TaxID=2093828 RepID=UPI00155E359C|nr:hypothetical protein [Neorhizobium tomejilense]